VCYLFTLFHFASSARTRNLIVTLHRSLAMGHSFTVGACGLWNSFPHRIKNERALGRFVGLVRTHFTRLLLFAGLDFFFFWDSLSSHSLMHIFTVFWL
jgi:hypothetical protein